MSYGAPEVSVEMLVALSRVPEHDREILLDRVVVGLSLVAIAERDGISRERVRQIEMRGRERLAAELREAGYGR